MNTLLRENVTVEAKPWYKSWTIRANAPLLLAVAIDYAIGEGFSFTDDPWFLAVVAIVNIGLRFKSDRPIAAKQEDVTIPRTAS